MQTIVTIRLDHFLDAKYKHVPIEDVEGGHSVINMWSRWIESDAIVIVWYDDLCRVVKQHPQYILPQELLRFKKLPNGVNNLVSAFQLTSDQNPFGAKISNYSIVFFFHNSRNEHTIYQLTYVNGLQKLIQSSILKLEI